MKRTFLITVFCILVSGCGSDSKAEREEKHAQVCVEPENPYSEGTGHYAGFKWAEENGGACSTQSPSFNEECEEYEEQEAKYEDCQSKER